MDKEKATLDRDQVRESVNEIFRYLVSNAERASTRESEAIRFAANAQGGPEEITAKAEADIARHRLIRMQWARRAEAMRIVSGHLLGDPPQSTLFDGSEHGDEEEADTQQEEKGEGDDDYQVLGVADDYSYEVLDDEAEHGCDEGEEDHIAVPDADDAEGGDDDVQASA